MATVTAIIPTYNRAALLERALESVRGQTRPVDEVIVVDDHSSDETAELLRRLEPPYRSHRMPRNSERGACRNVGLELAQGELVAFLDSDDEWEPDKLARQLPRLGDADALATGIRFIDQEGQPTGGKYIPTLRAGELFVNNVLLGSPSSLLIRRESARAVGGFPTNRLVQGSEDWIFLVKLLLGGHRIDVVPEPLVRYRVHPGGSTQRADNLARSMWWACDWMDREAVASTVARSERRSRAAAAIATAYLSERRPRRALPWIRRALTNGRLQARAYSAWRMLRTALRTALGRRTTNA
jgi:glycosyltransferase involved in cell wall biosynthesis